MDRLECGSQSGVTLGVGSIVGAGSVMTRDTEAYGIYVGYPGKLKRYRFNADIRRSLLESRWWDLPISFLLTLNFRDVKNCIKMIEEYNCDLKRK